MNVTPMIVAETAVGLTALYLFVTKGMAYDQKRNENLKGFATIPQEPNTPYSQWPDNDRYRFTKDWMPGGPSFSLVYNNRHEAFAYDVLQPDQKFPSTENTRALLTGVKNGYVQARGLRPYLLARNTEANKEVADFYSQVARRS